MSDDSLHVNRSEHVLRLTLHRPERSNALSPGLVERLLNHLEDTTPPRVCVIQGAGKLFCAGFDLDGLDDLSDGDLLWRFLRIERLLQAIHHAPFPVLVLAHGHAIGAGADLLAAASHRVGAPGTTVRMPGLNFGLALGTGRLGRLVGPDAAQDILLDTRAVVADEALAAGLLTDIRHQDRWDDVIDQLVERTLCLPADATAAMLGAIRHDARSTDIAHVVATAGRPGLADRVRAYRQSVHRSTG